MEEAWELAALVMSDATVSFNEWSGRHVRLKFQMFIAGISLYCATKFNLTEVNFFGTIKFDAKPDQTLVFCFLLCLTVFFLFCFVIRTFLEASHWSSEQKDLSSTLIVLYDKWRDSNQRVKSFLKHPLHEKIRAFNSIEWPADQDAKGLAQFEKAKEIYSDAVNLEVECKKAQNVAGNLRKQAPNLKKSLNKFRAGQLPQIGLFVNACDKLWSEATNWNHPFQKRLVEIQNALNERINPNFLSKLNMEEYKDLPTLTQEFCDDFDHLGKRLRSVNIQEKRRGYLLFWQNILFSIIIPVVSVICLICLSFDAHLEEYMNR